MENSEHSSVTSPSSFSFWDSSDDDFPIGFKNYNNSPPGFQEKPLQFNENDLSVKSSGNIPERTKKATGPNEEMKSRAKKFVRIFGLLYSSVEDDVKAFFKGFSINKIFLYNFNGISDGTGYVEFDSQKEVFRALKKDGHYLGERYIKVCPIEEFELDKLLRYEKTYEQYSSVGYVRVGGLPYECTSMEIIKFFKSIQIDEIVFGEFPQKPPIFYQAVIKFATKADGDLALKKDRQFIRPGERYLQIYRVDHRYYEDFKKNRSKNIVTLGQSSPLTTPQKRSESPPKKISFCEQNDWLAKDWASTAKAYSKIPSTKDSNILPLKKEVLADPLKTTLKTIKELITNEVNDDNFVLQTHVSNAVNLAVAIERKMQGDAEIVQNQQAEIEKLKKLNSEAGIILDKYLKDNKSTMNGKKIDFRNQDTQTDKTEDTITKVKQLEEELKLMTISYVDMYQENNRLKKEIDDMQNQYFENLIKEARKSNELEENEN